MENNQDAKNQQNISEPLKTVVIYESARKEANEEKYGNHSNSCVCCGRPTAEKQYIHATTDWLAINTEDFSMVNNSQGMFPIGPECAKRFKTEFIFNINF